MTLDLAGVHCKLLGELEVLHMLQEPFEVSHSHQKLLQLVP